MSKKNLDIPHIELNHIEDRSPERPFLKVRHGWYELVQDGKRSDPFPYDSVLRRSLNASVIFAHGVVSGERVIYLRSCVRPALMDATPKVHPVIWECAAGLIDDGETPQEAARRECLEELGFDYPLESFRELGHAVFPAVGICGERLYFFEVEVEPDKQKTPKLDGSALEEAGIIRSIPLSSALELMASGHIHDSKTELAIHRFFWTYSRR